MGFLISVILSALFVYCINRFFFGKVFFPKSHSNRLFKRQLNTELNKHGYHLRTFGKRQVVNLSSHSKPAYYGVVNSDNSRQVSIDLTPYAKIAHCQSFSESISLFMCSFEKALKLDSPTSHIYPLLVENHQLEQALKQPAPGYWSIYPNGQHNYIIPKADTEAKDSNSDHQPLHIEAFTENLSVIYFQPKLPSWFERDLLSDSDIAQLGLSQLELEAIALTNQSNYCVVNDFSTLETHPEYGFLFHKEGDYFAASTILNPYISMQAEDRLGIGFKNFCAFICCSDLLVITTMDPQMQQDAIHFAREHYHSGKSEKFFCNKLIYSNGVWSEGEDYIH